jgi:hypothetical protein
LEFLTLLEIVRPVLRFHEANIFVPVDHFSWETIPPK